MPTTTTRTRGQTSWSVSDIQELLAGELADGEAVERLRTPDRKGLSPVMFAALKSATTTDALLPLLSLLEAPSADEESKVDLMLNLLEQIAESQILLGQRLADIESRLSGQSVPSQQQPVASVRPASRS